MLPSPLHPSVVHFPIVLGVLLPFLALGAIIAIRRGVALQPAWALVFLLSVGLASSAFVANRTGEGDEEIVEDRVSERLIHEHEEAGERLLWLSGAAMALAALGFAPGSAGLAGRYGTAIAGAALIVASVQVGHLGGELVYEHGAAAAHVLRADGLDGEMENDGEEQDDTVEHDDVDDHDEDDD